MCTYSICLETFLGGGGGRYASSEKEKSVRACQDFPLATPCASQTALPASPPPCGLLHCVRALCRPSGVDAGGFVHRTPEFDRCSVHMIAEIAWHNTFMWYAPYSSALFGSEDNTVSHVFLHAVPAHTQPKPVQFDNTGTRPRLAKGASVFPSGLRGLCIDDGQKGLAFPAAGQFLDACVIVFCDRS